MKLALFGASGGVGRRVGLQAAAHGHTVRALVRQPEQAERLRQAGLEAVVGDLLGDWEGVLDGTDAVIWAAGAGAGGNYEAIDRDALIRVTDTLKTRGLRRFIVVSSLAVDRPEQMPPFLAAVLRVKAVSDAHIQSSGLDWTIVRPGGLTDAAGTGRIRVAKTLLSGMISRDDVAGVVLACLEQPSTIRQTFEVVAGEQDIGEALASLG
ncbi:MAG: SDR family oxidoreductase [Deinococcus sp.]|uniref:SDR family oxidoreductase n=1 Tax=Deinococcus sp. TaxID=47478 RepID=UPI0026DBB380|nr:SDR family oxidoreductase [Deinococcus sp.]MDO4245685.1 SDR family oxidoreductase [Deinococcus sp.]